MIFRQQVTLTSDKNAGTTGSGIDFGFGNNQKTKFALQATFDNGSGILENPTSAEIYLLPTNDSVAYGSSKIVDWNTAPSDGDPANVNGDVVGIGGVGPFSGVQVGWNITWGGSATRCIITINAETESGN